MKITIDLDLPKEKKTQFIFGEGEGKRFSMIVHEIKELNPQNVIDLAKEQIPTDIEKAKIQQYYEEIRGLIRIELDKFKEKKENMLPSSSF